MPPGMQVPKASGTPAVLPPPAAAPALPPGAKPKTFTPASLYLDDQGREVDAQGRLIQRNDTRVAAPTLKVTLAPLHMKILKLETLPDGQY